MSIPKLSLATGCLWLKAVVAIDKYILSIASDDSFRPTKDGCFSPQLTLAPALHDSKIMTAVKWRLC